MNKKTVEIIAQSFDDAINAQKGGAARVELVSALSEGGLTPSFAMIEQIIKNIDIEVAVMLRPISRSFCYEKHYLDVMKRDAEVFQDMGVKRLVLGILDKEGNVDLGALNYVLENINIDVTFHRAIDESRNILESVRTLNKCKKVTHILTSGGAGKAVDHLDIIKDMIKISDKRIMIGSGLNFDVLDKIKKEIDYNIREYDVHFGTFAQGSNGIVDEKKVREIVERFNS